MREEGTVVRAGAVVATTRSRMRPAEETCVLFLREVAAVVRFACRVDCVRTERARVERDGVVLVATERVSAEPLETDGVADGVVTDGVTSAVCCGAIGRVVPVAGVIESSAAIGDGVSVGCERLSRFADITWRARVLSSASTSPTGFESSEHAARDTVAVRVKAILRRAVFIGGRPASGFALSTHLFFKGFSVC